MTPRARQQGMLSEHVGDEVILYDSDRARAHRLNRTAALVWQNADGTRTVADHAAILQKELDPAANEDLVICAIDRLNAAHLLEETAATADAARAARRRFVQRVGLVGAMALLLPAVNSIAAPTPEQSISQVSCHH